MKSLQTAISTIQTFFIITAIYGIYSICIALEIPVPTLQDLLNNKTFALTKTPPTRPTEYGQICDLIALGYQVTSHDGALELCIRGGAK